MCKVSGSQHLGTHARSDGALRHELSGCCCTHLLGAWADRAGIVSVVNPASLCWDAKS